MRVRDLGLALVAVSLAGGFGGCRPPAPEGSTPTPPAKAAPQKAWPATFRDSLGEEVTLAAPPQRIVSLSPAITEMLFTIGEGGRLVGVTSYCDFPPEATKLPEVGSYTGFSVEKVLSLRPDVVVGMRGTSPESLKALRRAGLKVLAYDPITVGGVLDLMEELGHMTRDTPGSVPAVEELRARVAAVSAGAASLPRRPRTLVAVQVEPLYAAGPGNHLDDMVTLAGGENLAADADIPWPQYSLERAVEKDPEVLIGPSGHINDQEITPESMLADLKRSTAWSGTTAVKRGHVLPIHDDLLTLPGPRLVDGLEQMAATIRKAAETPQ